MDSHLQSDVKAHLDLACAKLYETESRFNDTERRLDETEKHLIDTKIKLNENTCNLKVAADLLQTTRLKLESLDKKVFTWKIDGFREILRRAKTGKRDGVLSDPFYTTTRTESHGYKVQVLIHPNGISGGENTHLSVFLVSLKGRYDAILPWPINKNVKFILIDQQKEPNQRVNKCRELFTNITTEFVRPETGKGRGYEQFISHRELLNSRRFIVNDTLFLQVEISSPSI